MSDTANQSSGGPSDVLSLEDSKALIGLCRAGKLYEVEEWIKAGWSLQVAPSVRKSPIEVAIETGFHSLIVRLARSESEIAVKNRALIAAVENRKLDLIELLVSHGAEVGAVPFADVLEKLRLDGTTDDLSSALARAAFSRSPGTLRYLLKLGANPNGKTNGGSAALDSCLVHVSFGDVRALWEKRLAQRHAVGGTIECVGLLAEHGARWVPDEVHSVTSVRRELLRCEPQVAVDVVKLLARHKACPEETLERLLDTPKMKAHLSQLGLRLLGQYPFRR